MKAVYSILLLSALSIVTLFSVVNFSVYTQSSNITYDNASLGIKILYPSDWLKHENGTVSDTTTDVVSFFPPGNTPGNSQAEVNISIDDISDQPGMTLAQYAKSSVDNLSRDDNILQFTVNNDGSDNGPSLAGSPAYNLVYTYSDQNNQDGKSTSMEIGTIKNDKVYIFTYDADSSVYDRFLPSVQQMIASFQIT